jgi:hypothetical protein
MRIKKNVTYLTADQLEERAIARIRQAQQLPASEAQQHVLKNAAQLRCYAAMKRLLVRNVTGVAINGASDVSA